MRTKVNNSNEQPVTTLHQEINKYGLHVGNLNFEEGIHFLPDNRLKRMEKKMKNCTLVSN